MESEARYAWVGAVIVGLIALIAAGLLWLQGGLGDHDFNRFTIYFRQQSLDGLQLNSDVKMYGIKVGKVVDYEILPTEAKNVRVVIEVNAKAPVMEGAVAMVNRNLLTGLASIEVNNLAEKAPLLTKIPEGEPYPVLSEGQPKLAKFAERMEVVAERADETLARLNTLLSDRNLATVGQTLDNLNQTSAAVAQGMPELNGALKASREAAVQVNQQLARLGPKLETTLDDTRQAVQEVRGSVAQLRLTSDLGLQELQMTGRALRNASQAVGDAARTLREPAGALFGPAEGSLGPGEVTE
ncbi:MAG: MCE family protein [Hydrogenophilaceae bacterium]|nr:MCE family protein [Hydrogenophilaceae bacterium]